MLASETIAIIKATAPVLAERGEELTRHFYRRMFTGNPEVQAFFNPAHQHQGTQQRALAGAICAFASNVDNLEVLAPAVELIAQKHASLGVKAEHYPIVGEHLLGSIREVLGEAATEEVVGAWAEAYGVLADILIGREGELYDHHRTQHGWDGFRDFIVERKVPESDRITSFYLKPADGGSLAPHLPGQYLTVRVPTPDGSTTMRNYSLSCRPGAAHYRISVKREPAADPNGVPGRVSNHLHDHVHEGDRIEVGPPCGEFVLDVGAAQQSQRPLVLISGGVGITPLLSMLHHAVDAGLDRDIYFIHAALHRAAHAFADEVRQLASQHDRLTTHFCYSEAGADDGDASHCDSQGFVTVGLLRDLLPDLDCDYYLCGPKAFMINLFGPLTDAGVDADQVHLEFFGPKQELEAASAAATP